jgi:group I intron endonuclease
MFYVYCYKNKTNGKCYIGKTKNISQRKSRHRRNAFVDKLTLPFYNALRKYGENNFDFQILEQFEHEYVIFDLEIFYIKAYKSNNSEYGYNLTAGGEGSAGLKHNENQIKANKLKVGDKNGNSKLTEQVVYQIFNDYKTGEYYIKQIADKYQVSPITIERLLCGKSWKHLNLDISSLGNIKRKNMVRGQLEKAVL